MGRCAHAPLIRPFGPPSPKGEGYQKGHHHAKLHLGPIRLGQIAYHAGRPARTRGAGGAQHPYRAGAVYLLHRGAALPHAGGQPFRLCRKLLLHLAGGGPAAPLRRGGRANPDRGGPCPAAAPGGGFAIGQGRVLQPPAAQRRLLREGGPDRQRTEKRRCHAGNAGRVCKGPRGRPRKAG